MQRPPSAKKEPEASNWPNWLRASRSLLAVIVAIFYVGAAMLMLSMKMGLLYYRELDTRQFVLLSIVPCAVGAFFLIFLLNDGRLAQFDFKIFGCSFKGKGGATVLWIGAFIALMAIVMIAAKVVA
jgi:hypothetical protein